MNDDQAETTRFSLRWLLGMVALLCVAFAALAAPAGSGWASGLVVVLPLVFALGFRAYKTAGAYALLVAFLWLNSGTVGYSPSATQRTQCSNNLKQIALALHVYNHHHGRFPPAYLADAQGNPMHSWRVLILPYLNPSMAKLYGQYRFDEPWNGPHNARLAEEMPDVFRCPGDLPDPAAPESAWETSYVAVVGPNTAWPGAKGRAFQEITDGVHNTILLVESAPSGIPWMAPRDLDLAPLAPKINAPQGQGIRSRHIGGAMVALTDGSTTYLSDSIDPQQLRGLLTADGGERVQLPR